MNKTIYEKIEDIRQGTHDQYNGGYDGKERIAYHYGVDLGIDVIRDLLLKMGAFPLSSDSNETRPTGECNHKYHTTKHRYTFCTECGKSSTKQNEENISELEREYKNGWDRAEREFSRYGKVKQSKEIEKIGEITEFDAFQLRDKINECVDAINKLNGK